MASNTPQTTTKPSSNTNPTPTSPSLSPYDVRCVTQTQDSERLFNSPNLAPDHHHILTAICDAEHADNTPDWRSPQAPLVPTPVIASPVRALVQQDVAAELFGTESKLKRKRSSARNSGATKTSKKRPYANPQTTLLWFLRESFVDAHAITLNGKTLSTSHQFKPVLDFWAKTNNSTRKKVDVQIPF